MGQREQLKSEMRLEEVRKVLKGWHESMPSAYISPDSTHLFYTVDFNPPVGSAEGKLRATFDNGRLLFWGDPADPHENDDATQSA